MGKKTTINNPTTPSINADCWVKEREGNKSFTLNLPVSLHTKLKIKAAETGKKMGQIVQEALEETLNK